LVKEDVFMVSIASRYGTRSYAVFTIILLP